MPDSLSAGTIADLKGITYDELAKTTTRNTKKLFGIK